MVNIRKRGKVYQYQFEIAKVAGKRKYISKSGFKTKNEALMAGMKAYDEYINGGNTKDSQMSYADYLDYWMKEYFEINYKYSTAKRYKETFKVLKEEIGKYKLSFITPFLLNQSLLKIAQKCKTKEGVRNYQKVIKSSFEVVALQWHIHIKNVKQVKKIYTHEIHFALKILRLIKILTIKKVIKN